MKFSGYLSELFELALDGKIDELSDREKRLLVNATRVILEKLGCVEG